MEDNNNVEHTGYDTAKVLGIDVQFSKMLGSAIVENFMKSLTEEDMKKINDYIQKDLFEEFNDYGNIDKNGNPSLNKRVKESWEEQVNRYDRRTVKSIGDIIKKMFNVRVKEDLKAKIEEIVKTTDYKEKIDKIANEVVEYATEGYKEDLKANIRRKLICGVMDERIVYDGMGLRDIIHMEINNWANSNRTY